jgi:hypothetical protein
MEEVMKLMRSGNERRRGQRSVVEAGAAKGC